MPKWPDVSARREPAYHLHITKELAAPAAAVAGTSPHQDTLSEAALIIRIYINCYKYGSDYVIV